MLDDVRQEHALEPLTRLRVAGQQIHQLVADDAVSVRPALGETLLARVDADGLDALLPE